jgi:thiamine biosynthesis protein ThiC
VGATPKLVNLRDEEGYAKLVLAKRELAASLASKEAAAKRRREEDDAAAKRQMEQAWAAEEARKRDEEKARKAKEEKEREKAAATVKRPTTCCPMSVPGIVGPAQEVLLRFCDAEQREQWLKERRLVARAA